MNGEKTLVQLTLTPQELYIVSLSVAVVPAVAFGWIPVSKVRIVADTMEKALVEFGEPNDNHPLNTLSVKLKLADTDAGAALRAKFGKPAVLRPDFDL